MTDDASTLRAERDRLAELLVDAEQRLANVPELERRIDDLEHDVRKAVEAGDVARREAWELDQARLYSRRALRRVRPLIGQLRKLKHRIRG